MQRRFVHIAEREVEFTVEESGSQGSVRSVSTESSGLSPCFSPHPGTRLHTAIFDAILDVLGDGKIHQVSDVYVKAFLLPANISQVDLSLDFLEEYGFLRRCRDDGQRLVQIAPKMMAFLCKLKMVESRR